MESGHITLDANSHTISLVKWLDWFEKKHGFVPSKVKIRRSLMEAICYENGMPLGFSEYSLIGVSLGSVADA